ncbi:MAG: ABC transporter ATP-binding protein [Planctomycetales bacterium]|nr:ABC transporter ATP-binding protein [Planctomycetales bacterium]
MIELSDVNIQAGNFALQGITFSVRGGDYCVLMGRTGKGKTTILESICGLRRVTSGRILIAGQDVTRWLPGDREIGYVPQDLALFPNLTVREHLQFALRIRQRKSREIEQRVQELAQELGIAHLMQRGVQNLSGGERQRVALGRALSFQPQVLLLDEPLSALDEQTREEMMALLERLKAHRVTTLHVTHNRNEADALADQRLELCDGVIVSL